MILPRLLEKPLLKSQKSILLLGPRQTGKSTLIRSLQPDISFNLADEETFLQFAQDPGLLRNILAKKKNSEVFIDEVQRLPKLLNTIQALIDETPRPPRFLLTGSSARKLRRGKANLLPGRIHSFELGPLTASELGYQADLDSALSTGFLPGIYLDAEMSERKKTLRSYAATYLKEEIQSEALTRNLEGFARFLKIAGASSGHFTDMTRLASEAGINRVTAGRFFEILEDTLIFNTCEPFAKSERKRLVQHPKRYAFDCGILNALLSNFQPSADRKGPLFENLIFNQIRIAAAARDLECRISTYRTENHAEIDFIVELEGKVFAIEAKASANLGASDLRGFQSFRNFYAKPHTPMIFYTGVHSQRIHEVDAFPWQEGLKEMGL